MLRKQGKQTCADLLRGQNEMQDRQGQKFAWDVVVVHFWNKGGNISPNLNTERLFRPISSLFFFKLYNIIS